ncbi:MAG: VWA domain-containing protein, partial [Chloroflexota bacterium]|nr:VWA domain-containing protein [Chloroflexota bacterium]
MVAWDKRFRIAIFLSLLLFSLVVAGLLTAQEAAPVPRAEITGVDPSNLPEVVVSVNVYDTLGQPVTGLSAADFSVIEPLTDVARVVLVENITNDNLPFSTVLVIDVSSSMFDFPIGRAREAARAFVDNIRAIDSVAIVTFGNTIDVIQPFTTDKATLYTAIDSIVAFGQTALYQGTYDAVSLASSAPNARRAVVVLSDGAEFGGVSVVGRAAARELAVTTGVPIYTIGVGYGFDRTYLESLSDATNARFYESPTLTELTDIFGNLARLLSSQYVVTLNVDVPADGTEYALALRVQTAEGEAITPAGNLRAPIPIPLVDFPAPPSAPIDTLTTLTATIRADQTITSVMFGVLDATGAGVMAQNDTEAPYTIEIDPVALLPGDYMLTAIASDADGDMGGGNLPFSVAALPSVVTFDPDLATLAALTEPVTLAINISGQTAPTDVIATIGGGAQTLDTPYTITLDPRRLVPGANELAIDVTNAGGITNTTTAEVEIAALPPIVTIDGLTDGQLIETPTTFTLSIDAQTALTRVSAALNDASLTANAEGSYTLDPRLFRPGAAEIVVDVADQDSENRVRFPVEIGALPPTIIVDGLTAGETLTGNRAVTLTFDSQTPVIHLAVFIDGVDLAHLVQAPFIVGLDVLRIPPGAHTLRLVADNSGGRSTTLDLPFTISPAPAASATATALQATATATAVTATYRAQLTGTAAQSTAFAQGTAAALQATAQQSTRNAQATAAQATVFAGQTAVAAQATAAQATVFAQRTQVQSTANALATAGQATIFAQSTATAAQATAQQATAFTGATQAAASATAAQSALNAQATAQQATVFAQRTDVQATAFTGATQMAASATAAQSALNAQATAQQATVFAERTDVQATAFTGATQMAASATAAQSALNAQATAAQATVFAERTDVQATAFTGATQMAASATAAQSTSDVQSTRQVVASATAEQAMLNAAVTQQAASATAARATLSVRRTAQQATIIVQVTGTSLAQTRTQVSADVRMTATAAQSTLDAQRTISASTRAVQRAINATETSVPLTQTQSVRDAFTAEAATQTAQFTPSNTPSETPPPTLTLTPSATPSATLMPSETPPPTLTLTPSATPSATLMPSETSPPTLTLTPSATPSATLMPSETSPPTLTLTPSATPSATLMPSNTSAPTSTPDIPASQTADAQAAALTSTQSARETQLAGATATRVAATQTSESVQRTRQAERLATSNAATRAVLVTNAAQAQAASRATQETRATRAAANETALVNTEIAATDFSAATQTEIARPTETFTPTATPTETPSATLTLTPTDDIPASATAVSAATGTAVASTATNAARATAVQATAEQATAIQVTIDTRSTQDAERAATSETRSTLSAQATLDMAAAALGTITPPPTVT